jgi:hypothetical protein
MDLLAFADFVLAWDHRNHPASVGYFFKIFDIQHKVGLVGHDMAFLAVSDVLFLRGFDDVVCWPGTTAAS